MGRLLIIGCGGVAGVAIHKCCQNSKTFSEICIASRTKSKCDDLKEKLEKTTETKITTAQVNADNVDEVIQKEIGLVFMQVLTDAGVYKRTPEGMEAFERFIKSL